MIVVMGVLINCHNKKELLGRVRAFDWYCNMVLESVLVPKTGKGKKKALPVIKDRLTSKIFLRGDISLFISHPFMGITK
ncbi:hypothetical protein RJ639_019148 [Escallonia herrerae]|uniref:Small nuclear ribonucleoprotein Sm D2 n=1 Tax=Escallonia herrerae TaxID=1293975 RepID=A0AA88V8U2_9ASTE|nr:hypothetical protein RJ639_019148 [Escallonia herrerae]